MTKTTNDTVAYLKRQTNNPMAQQAAAAIEANPSMVKRDLREFFDQPNETDKLNIPAIRRTVKC